MIMMMIMVVVMLWVVSILFVTDPIKNALDFTQLYLTTVKRNQGVRNARRAIGESSEGRN
jgi:hypothetical protein